MFFPFHFHIGKKDFHKLVLLVNAAFTLYDIFSCSHLSDCFTASSMLLRSNRCPYQEYHQTFPNRRLLGASPSDSWEHLQNNDYF